MLTAEQIASIAAKALEDKKAKDVKVLRTTEHTVLADYFVICNGTSSTHIKALVDEVDKHRSEADAIRHKIAYVTEDRKGNGLVLSQSIKVNTSLANLDAISSRTVIDGDKEYAVAEKYRDLLKIKTPSVEQLVGNLSGGNQQKVLLAKWMFAEPDVLLLDEPTRGIDVGAKYEIYCIINDLAAAGKCVVLISSELPEVLGMSDRIYIMNEARIVGEMKASEATQESIMAMILRSGRGA